MAERICATRPSARTTSNSELAPASCLCTVISASCMTNCSDRVATPICSPSVQTSAYARAVSAATTTFTLSRAAAAACVPARDASIERRTRPKQIDFVGNFEQIVDDPDALRRVAAQLEYLVGGGIAAIDAACRDGRLWVSAGMRRREHRVSRGEVGLGRRQIGIGCESLVQQPIQARVLVQPPPVVTGGPPTFPRQGRSRSHGAVAPLGRRGRPIIRADTTARHRGGKQLDGKRRP